LYLDLCAGNLFQFILLALYEIAYTAAYDCSRRRANKRSAPSFVMVDSRTGTGPDNSSGQRPYGCRIFHCRAAGYCNRTHQKTRHGSEQSSVHVSFPSIVVKTLFLTMAGRQTIRPRANRT
jgi:hypothetical protein